MSADTLRTLSGAEAKAIELKDRDFEAGSPKKIIYRGRECMQTTYEKNKVGGTGERILRGLGWVAGSVATAGLLNISKTFREDTFTPVYDGSVKEHVYEESTNTEQINEEAVGCDPKDPTSVRKFLNDNRHEWREANGHNFIVGKGRKGISFFYFIPNGDVSKACSVKFWTAKNGKSVMDTAKQLRAIRTYCASFEDIETKWAQEIPNLATSLMNRDKSGIRTLEEVTKAIKKQRRTVVIDARAGVARMYGPYDPNKVNPDSHRTGTSIELAKETKDEINRAHGKSMEHKEPLAGERPFKAPPPRNPLEDQGSSQSQRELPGSGKQGWSEELDGVNIGRYNSPINVNSESD